MVYGFGLVQLVHYNISKLSSLHHLVSTFSFTLVSDFIIDLKPNYDSELCILFILVHLEVSNYFLKTFLKYSRILKVSNCPL